MKISTKFISMSNIYKLFCDKKTTCLDFSRRSLEDQYSFESTGSPRVCYSDKNEDGLFNGYAVGKHLMDVTIAMWLEDIESNILTKYDLMVDLTFPSWFLSKVINIPISEIDMIRKDVPSKYICGKVVNKLDIVKHCKKFGIYHPFKNMHVTIAYQLSDMHISEIEPFTNIVVQPFKYDFFGSDNTTFVVQIRNDSLTEFCASNSINSHNFHLSICDRKFINHLSRTQLLSFIQTFPTIVLEYLVEAYDSNYTPEIY